MYQCFWIEANCVLPLVEAVLLTEQDRGNYSSPVQCIKFIKMLWNYFPEKGKGQRNPIVPAELVLVHLIRSLISINMGIHFSYTGLPKVTVQEEIEMIRCVVAAKYFLFFTNLSKYSFTGYSQNKLNPLCNILNSTIPWLFLNYFREIIMLQKTERKTKRISCSTGPNMNWTVLIIL